MNRAYLTVACAGIVAAGLAAALPSSGIMSPSSSPGPVLYGVAVVEHIGVDGQIISTETVHNQLLDAGEQHILQQAFSDGSTAVADDTQVGAICLSADTTAPTETMTAATFNSNADTDDNAASSAVNCITDDGVDLSTAGTAVVGPLTFDVGTANTNNWYNGDTPAQIGVCAAQSANNAVRGCTAPLFATVALTGTSALATGESLTVTYTFNIASPSS